MWKNMLSCAMGFTTTFTVATRLAPASVCNKFKPALDFVSLRTRSLHVTVWFQG